MYQKRVKRKIRETPKKENTNKPRGTPNAAPSSGKRLEKLFHALPEKDGQISAF